MLSSIFIALIGFTGAAQAASAVDTCVKTNMTGIKNVDDQLKSFGVKNVNDPCPEQDAYDRGVYNCSKKVEQLRKEQEKLKEIIEDKCEVAQELQALAKKNSGKQTDSEDGSKSLNEKAKHIAQKEYDKLEAIKNRVKTMREYFASLAEGAKNVQQEVTDKASSAPKDRDDQTERLNEAGRKRGARASNHEEGKNFFNGDSISKVESLISKAREGGLTKGDVDQIKTPLTKEPLQMAAAADDWTKQIEARQKVVKSQAAVYDDNYFTTSDRSKKLGNSENSSEGGKASGGGGDSAGNAASSMGDASKALQAASGLTSAGSGGGSSGAAESGAGATPDYSGYMSALPSGASPSGSSGAANSYEAGGTNTNYDGGTSPNTTPTSAGGLKAALTDGGRSVIGKNDGTNGIKNLDTSTAVNTSTGNDRTGSSATKGSSLREALRERLNQSMGDSSGGGGAVAAVSGSGASSGGGGTGASASSGAAPNLLPLSTPIASDNALEASTASVGGDLGNTDFSLAGSETDAAVKGMLKDFGVGEESASRAPASLNQPAPEILTSDSPSLFTRTRDVHQRSLKKGLVINGLRAKL